jgi:hypothetical protein
VDLKLGYHAQDGIEVIDVQGEIDILWVPETLSWPLTWCLLPGLDRQVRHLAATEPYIQAL